MFNAIKRFFTGEDDEVIGLKPVDIEEEEEEESEISFADEIDDLSEEVTPPKKTLTTKEKLDIAKQSLSELNLTDAYVKLSSILLDLANDLSKKNDRTHNYYSFSNRIESEINTILESKIQFNFFQTRWVTAQGISYTDIYAPFIKVLIESNKLDEAKKTLKEAIRWNPVSSRIHILYSDFYKKKGEIKPAETYLIKALTLATTKADLSEAYMKLAFIKKMKNENRLASALYVHGMRFSKDVNRVRNANANGIELMSNDEAVFVLKENNIQTEAGKIVQSALYRLILKAKERHDKTHFDEYMEIVKSILISEDKLQKLNCVNI